MTRVRGRIWTDTAAIKLVRARPHPLKLGCHTGSLRLATAAAYFRPPDEHWAGGLIELRRWWGGGVGGGIPRDDTSILRSMLLAQASGQYRHACARSPDLSVDLESRGVLITAALATD